MVKVIWQEADKASDSNESFADNAITEWRGFLTNVEFH